MKTAEGKFCAAMLFVIVIACVCGWLADKTRPSAAVSPAPPDSFVVVQQATPEASGTCHVVTVDGPYTGCGVDHGMFYQRLTITCGLLLHGPHDETVCK